MALKYYKSKIAGLTVISDPEVAYQDGEVAHPSETFVPYYERLDGDQVRVGYLATDNEAVQEKCENDFNVQSINKDEWEKSTDASKNAKVKRAPY